MEYLNSNVIKQYVRKDGSKAESTRFFNYPYAALEEAVVNSLYHRSYENPTPNEIRVYKTGVDRRIEILSYPGPLPPIDESALVQLKITARNYRNLKLGDWLKNLRLAEKYATGIPTILNALELNGSPKPILSTDAARSHFLVVFRIHPDAPMEIANSTSVEVETVVLSDAQQQILERLIEEPIVQSEIIKLFTSDLPIDLEYLLSKELIKAKENSGDPIYFITQKGRDSLKNSF
jgi:ATP-dependent DNA helicase RecG